MWYQVNCVWSLSRRWETERKRWRKGNEEKVGTIFRSASLPLVLMMNQFYVSRLFFPILSPVGGHVSRTAENGTHEPNLAVDD
jgi:hypothetical protein